MDETLPELDVNRVSDIEDNEGDETIHTTRRGHTIRQSKRVLQQLRANTKDGLHHIAALVVNKKAEVPDLSIKNKKFTRGWAGANFDLKIREWAFKDHFAGAVIGNKTGEKFEYRDLIKKSGLGQRWSTSLANKL